MPLLVLLAGQGAEQPGPIDAAWRRAADEHGFILLAPLLQYPDVIQAVDCLARDLAEMIDAVRHDYSIHAECVSLVGSGEGGSAAWLLGTRYPDRWAALCIVGGRTSPQLEAAAAGSAPPWRQLTDLRPSAVELAENLCNLPVRFYHGVGDTAVPFEHTLRMRRALKAVKIDHDFRFRAVAGSGIPPGLVDDVAAFVGGYALLPLPRQVVLRAAHLDEAAAHWLRVGRFAQWHRPVRLEGRIEENAVEVKTENVQQLWLQLTAGAFKQRKPITVDIDGKRAVRWTSPPRAPQCMQKGDDGQWRYVPRLRRPQGDRRGKGPGLCGPVRHAMRSTLSIVYGTGGEADKKVNSEQADAVAQRWRLALGTPCRVLPDSQFRRGAEKGPNLVLLGTPGSNSALARMLGRLPVKIGEDTIELAGRSYRGEHLGLVGVLPHPSSDTRYVVLMTGTSTGAIDRIAERPVEFDFFLFDAKTTQDPATAVAFGWLGTDWRPDPDSTFGRARGAPATRPATQPAGS
jgi:pimeloyl-ACP methyl ester carboxylesterase